MATRIEDRWLWLGVGVFTLIAIKSVSHGLQSLLHLTTIHNPPKLTPTIPKPQLSSGVDSIKNSSLEILATCDNQQIRKAATTLLWHRLFSNPEAVLLLLADLDSDDPEVRRRAQKANLLLQRYDPSYERGLLWEPRRRGREDSFDEQELRRRRREAVIVNEGNRPVIQDDIIQEGGRGRLSAEEAREAELALEFLTNMERYGEDVDADVEVMEWVREN
ncbi:hypothetical protein GQ43DRAFT_469718 [Delitschia confertaspora ATCC 74209]|uniref:Uncharacterized protein n=1 Tax=Delitschia confertaspora ATCC 74209 TaxID=1513339 RepID=A0A9P4JV29_9PLEO|nr:hypothetical protein GQ43DRAFT_469718 [Delitschia confertaspora ATCC 74209]